VPDRTEAAVAILALGAAGLVIAAPVLGRAGAPLLANAAMAGAATCGLASFVVVAVHSFRQGRRPARDPSPRRERRESS